MNHTTDLIDHYNEFFYITKADTPKLLVQAYKLRYEVYIKECGYKFKNTDSLNNVEKSKSTYFDEIEKDLYDKQSHHCLLVHKSSNMPIGYVRLIPYCENTGLLLPVESYGIKFDQRTITKLRTESTGEISRLTLHPLFRRRLNDQLDKLYNSDETDNKRYRVNYLPVCLVLASLALMFENKMEFTVGLMDKRVSLLYRKYGVLYEQIGPAVEINGIRTPNMIYRQETYNNLPIDFQELFKVIHNELISSNTPVVDKTEA